MHYSSTANRTFDYDAELELDGICVGVTIEYDVSPYVPATYMDPEEGGEVEDILSVHVNYALGETYDLNREEIGSWVDDLELLALEYVLEYFDRYELLEAAGDYE